MRACPDCGKELAPGEDRCPLCGAETPEPVPPAPGEALNELADRAASSPAGDAPPTFGEETADGVDAPLAAAVKRKGRAAVFVPIAVACAVVLGLAVWLASGLLQSPDKGFFKEHQTLFRGLGEAAAPLTQRFVDPSQRDLDLTATVRDGDSLGEAGAILNGAALRVQVDVEEAGGIVNAALDLGGDTLLEATVTGNKDGVLGFYIPQFSETYYTLDSARFLENNADGQLDASRPEISPEAWEETFKTYADILTDTVHKNNVTKERTKFFSYNNSGMGFSGTAYVFAPTAEDLETLFARLADEMEGDEALRIRVNTYLRWNGSLLGDGDLVDRLAADLRENGGELARTVADGGFTWTIRVGKDDYGRCRQVEVSWDNGRNALRLERRTESGTMDGVYFDLTADGMETAKLTAAHSGVNGEWFGGLWVGDLWIDFQQIDLEKQSSLGLCYGSYNVYSVEQNTLLFCFGVEAGADGGTDHTVRVDTDTEGNSVTVDLHTTDRPVSLTLPDAPREDITNYTTDDFEALGESWAEGVSALATQFVLYAYQHQ